MILYRADLIERYPELPEILHKLEGVISERRMAAMNARAKIDRVPEEVVAADFLSDVLGIGRHGG